MRFFLKTRRRPVTRPLVRVERLEDRTTPSLFTNGPGTPQTFGGSTLNNNGAAAVADFNDDGNLDMVVSNYGNVSGGGSNQITILNGQGDGKFVFSASYGSGNFFDLINFVTVGDLNSDGKPDIVTAQRNFSGSKAGSVSVLLNTGGTFSAATTYPSNGNMALWVGIGNFNADSAPDIAVANFGNEVSQDTYEGNNVSILENITSGGKGTGTFGSPFSYAKDLTFIPSTGAVADFSGDGLDDIAILFPGVPALQGDPQPAGNATIMVNNGAGFDFSSGTFSSGGVLPVACDVADVDNDGDNDLVVANAGDVENASFGLNTSVAVLLGGGNSTFGLGFTNTSSFNSAFGVSIADFNLDGRSDFSVADYGDPDTSAPAVGRIHTFVAKSTGSGYTYDSASLYKDSIEGNQFIVTGDFDGKGNPDHVVVGAHNHVVTRLATTRPTSTTLAASTNSASAGTNITFTATTTINGGYTETPSGGVDFFDGTTKLGSGTLALTGSDYKATFATTALAAGTHSITAKYTGQYVTLPFTGVSVSAAQAVTITGSGNTNPTIGDVTDKSVTAGQVSGPHSFTVGDAETAVGSLTMSAKSSNTSLIPVSAITFGGSGASRTVSIQSTAATSGTSTITITVTDGGGLTASDTFVLTVTGSSNTAPTISNIADQSTTTGTLLGPIPFTVGDAETAPGSLIVSATSSNTTLVPNGNIFFGGSGTDRSMLISPAAGQNGTTTITVTVSDGTLTAFDTFVLTVAPPNTPPTISDIANQFTPVSTLLGPINFTIGDGETAPGSLAVTALSSNTALVPNGSIFLGGSGANRSVIINPAAGQSGTTTITVTVSDGVLSTNDTFLVTVGDPKVSAITSTSSNGTYSTGQSVNVTLNFSDSLTLAGGNLLVTLDTGAIVSITPFTGTSASGTYLIVAGQTSADLNVTNLALAGGATLRNAGGVNASLALPTSNLAVNKDILVNPAPPSTVSFITVNTGSAQRSRLTTINVTFTGAVDAANFQALGAITLTRTLGGSPVVVQSGAAIGSPRITVSPGSGANVLALTFSENGAPTSAGVEFGSLADGYWQLAIPSVSYTSALNDPTLRRLFGDINGDGTINGATDFAQFGNVFGTTVAANPFDYNNDGTIDGPNDFAQFGARFGKTL